ncbi:MAG TPA: type II toxin-antitoxin system prevent-host-death family antitoxin [Rhodothermales bacterium]|nr:type II toxin-antitoxin system prevent-host-death family antitoxin [Rhodothermales bacterium]
MSTDTTYTDARANFARIWDRVISEREAVVIHRRGKEDVALIPADELSSLLETVHLLRSPKNAERLLAALAESYAGGGEVRTVEDLRTEFGLDKE